MDNHVRLCADEYISWKGPDGTEFGLLCRFDDDAKLNPRNNAKMSIMVCHDDRHAIGDNLLGSDLEEKLDRIVRGHIFDETIFEAIQAGKVPGIDIEPDGMGNWNVFETYVPETADGNSEPTRELVYEGIHAFGLYEIICDDLNLAQFVAILSTEAEVKPLLLTEQHDGKCRLSIGGTDDYGNSCCVGAAIVFEDSVFFQGEDEMTDEEWREKANEVIKNEVETYNLYLTGETYYYTLHKLDSEEPANIEFLTTSLGADITENGVAEFVDDENDTSLLDAIEAGKYTTKRAIYQEIPVFQ